MNRSIFEEDWKEKQVKDLKCKVDELERQIAEYQLQIEVLVAAMYQTNTPSGRSEADAVDISHRIFRLISDLKQENALLMQKARA